MYYFAVLWFIARKWDLKKAEVMFRDAVAFREKMRLDHILEEYEPSEVKLSSAVRILAALQNIC